MTREELKLKSKDEIIDYYIDLCNQHQKIIKDLLVMVQNAPSQFADELNRTLPRLLHLSSKITEKDIRVVKHMATYGSQRKELYREGLEKRTVDAIVTKMKELFDIKKHRLTQLEWKGIEDQLKENHIIPY